MALGVGGLEEVVGIARSAVFASVRASARPAVRSRRHAGTTVFVLVHDLHIRVLTTSGQLLRYLRLDPSRDHQPQPRT
jgi:hypothetical protein